ITSYSILTSIEYYSEEGELILGYINVQLKDTVEPVFINWINASFPDRAQKVLNLIRSMRGGNLGEKRFHERYKGEGNIAGMIHDTFALGKRKFFPNQEHRQLSTEHFTGSRDQQLRLF